MELKKKYVKLPGNKIKVIFKKRKPKSAKCGICGKELQGIPRLRKGDFRKLSKSERRPNRPYGGNLCSRCMRNEIIRRASD